MNKKTTITYDQWREITEYAFNNHFAPEVIHFLVDYGKKIGILTNTEDTPFIHCTFKKGVIKLGEPFFEHPEKLF